MTAAQQARHHKGRPTGGQWRTQDHTEPAVTLTAPASTALIDETGNTYGELTVLHRSPSGGDGAALWSCVCSCGKQTRVEGRRLRSGATRSCGHLAGAVDETGNTYGELTVMHRAPASEGSTVAHWSCQCSCGKVTTVRGDCLRQGNTRSCGHLSTGRLPAGGVPDEAGWGTKCDALATFVRNHGRLPRRRAAVSDEAKLGRWLEDVRVSARTGWRPSLTTPERLRVLDDAAPGWCD